VTGEGPTEADLAVIAWKRSVQATAADVVTLEIASEVIRMRYELQGVREAMAELDTNLVLQRIADALELLVSELKALGRLIKVLEAK
jgi:hypothetical protein